MKGQEELPPLSPAGFLAVKTMLYKDTGVSLGEDKAHYVRFRLSGICPGSLDDFVQNAVAEPDLRELVVEAVLNHETSFFRDWSPFLALRDVLLPELIERRKEERVLRIWSGACSYGQEVYSLVLLLEEHFREALAGWRVEFLASDVSNEALEKARAASYTRLEVNRGLPAALLLKYFESTGKTFRLKAPFRNRVSFEQINLLQSWPSRAPFDLIVLRNVLIYLEVRDKIRVLERMRGAMRPDGALLLGSAETTLLLDRSWTPRSVAGSVAYVLNADKA